MTKYIIAWNISGEAEIEADSPEEAETKFEQLSVADLAREGELESCPPETEEERAAIVNAWLRGANVI